MTPPEGKIQRQLNTLIIIFSDVHFPTFFSTLPMVAGVGWGGDGANLQQNVQKTVNSKQTWRRGVGKSLTQINSPWIWRDLFLILTELSAFPPTPSVAIYDTWMCKHFVWCKNGKEDLEIKERGLEGRNRVLVCLKTVRTHILLQFWSVEEHAQHLYFRLIWYCLFGGPSFVICLEAVIFISLSGWSLGLPIRWRVLSVVWLGLASRWPFYCCVMRACLPDSL